jgi:hypothetical protein
MAKLGKQEHKNSINVKNVVFIMKTKNERRNLMWITPTCPNLQYELEFI